MISLDHISFKSKEAHILKDITFQVEAGSKVALLGSNGSGKSILIDIITGNLSPTQGHTSIKEDPQGRRVGVLFDNVHLFPRLKVKEICKYLGVYLNCLPWWDDALIDTLQLQSLLDKQYAFLSAGERKRVQLYLALIGNPYLLILDEPTANLDPNIRARVWAYIHAQKNLTVLLTTHQWDEVKPVVNSVAFIYNGRLLTPPVSPAELVSNFASNDTKIMFPRFEGYLQLIGREKYYEKDDTVNVFPVEKKNFLRELSGWTTEFSIAKFDLRDIYNFLTV